MHACMCVRVCVYTVDCMIGRYVELEEMLSLKDKEILEKTHRLEELSTQVSNNILELDILR